MSAEGTGSGRVHRNYDEAYELALRYARTKFTWRQTYNRVLVMIGDCRPHEKDYVLNRERIDWSEEIRMLRDMNVKINAVQCKAPSYADSFFQKIASTTFGHHVQLENMKDIENVLMSICYREAGLGFTKTTGSMQQREPLQSQQMAPDPIAIYCPTEGVTNPDSDLESDEEDQKVCGSARYRYGYLPKRRMLCNG